MEVFELNHEQALAHFTELLREDRMTRFRTEFLVLHNYDQSELFEDFEAEDRKKLYQFLSPTELADIFDHVEVDDEEFDFLFHEMTPQLGAAILGEMNVDNAADIMNMIDDRDLVMNLIRLIPPESAREISRLMKYTDDTAGSIMTTEFLAVKESDTLGEAYHYLRQMATEAESIYYVYVTDDRDRLLGVLSLRDLIVGDENRKVGDVMNTRIISIQVNDDREEVAKMVRDYNLYALPVIGFDHELLGIITVDDVMDVMQEEAESDYSGLAMVDVTEEHVSPLSASKSRLPWLVTLLFLGMGTSTLISRYDSLIESASILSAFVTLITGTAGNAGTQSLAVAVRKITNKSEDDDFFKSILFEVLTGLITGLVVGLAVVAIVFVWQRNLLLGAIIGIAMTAAIFVANLAGSLIPKLMNKLGFDPAVASGPFISTLSDLTSVFIYFSIASLFLDMVM